MAGGVRVHISHADVRRALTATGQPLDRWVRRVQDDSLEQFQRRCEDNLVENALHRGGEVGGYRAGIGSAITQNQHGIQFKLTNDAPHAIYAEEGRGPSMAWQRFSWSRASGRIKWYSETGGRDGQHAMLAAINSALARNAEGYVPLKP